MCLRRQNVCLALSYNDRLYQKQIDCGEFVTHNKRHENKNDIFCRSAKFTIICDYENIHVYPLHKNEYNHAWTTKNFDFQM